MEFTKKEVENLLEMFAGDEEVKIKVIEVGSAEISHSGPGLYGYYDEYPEEGAIFLGDR